jgi:hypothetical protein
MEKKNKLQYGSILFSAKAENAADRLGFHALIVRANDADRNPAGPRGNHTLIRRVFIHSSIQACPSV